MEASNASFQKSMDERFARMDERFASMEAGDASLRKSMDERFTNMEARMDKRFVSMEARMDKRFASMGARMEAGDASLRETVEKISLKLDENTAQMKINSRKVGSLTNKLGSIIESIVLPGIVDKFNEKGFEFDEVSSRVDILKEEKDGVLAKIIV
jgi:hypothetical protein